MIIQMYLKIKFIFFLNLDFTTILFVPPRRFERLPYSLEESSTSGLYDGGIFCRSDGIPTRIMFKVSHETCFPTLETCLFRCIHKFTVPYFRLLIDTTVSVSTALFASLSYGPIYYILL